MTLFPEPQSMELFDQTYSFPMKDQYDDLTAFFHLVQAGLPGIRVATAPLLEKEEYRLTVDESGVLLEASCGEGLFRAVTSLWQMLRRNGGQLRCMRVSDKPALPRRGYMLDISRGKKPRVDTIKGIPFVITGAMKSPDKDPEESAYNLLFAIGCIEKGTSGVVFRNSDRIPSLYKAYAITSPDLDGIYKECKDCVEPEIKDRIDFLTRDKLPRVLVIPAFPGAVIPEDGFDRVLLCCNHSGTASAKLVPLVSKWTSEGKKVFMAPIPKKGGYYESRKKLVEAGATELPGMPIEGAWCEALLR